MVKEGNLIKLHESVLAVVQKVTVIERRHFGADGHFLALKVIQQDNPTGFCVYNVSLTEEGEITTSDLIWGETNHSSIQSLTVEKPD